MCLLSFKSLSVQKADNDIITYKVILESKSKKGNMRSPYYKFYWDLDKVYTKQKNLIVNVGGGLWYTWYTVEEGFHSYLNLSDAQNDVTCWLHGVIVKCVIPAGSDIVSNDKEIVSNKLKIIEKISGHD